MTEGNTQITLHDESLDFIVDRLLEAEQRYPNGEAETIANTINAQR